MLSKNQWEYIGDCIYCGGPAYQMEEMGKIQWKPKIYGCQCRLIDIDDSDAEQEIYYFEDMREAA